MKRKLIVLLCFIILFGSTIFAINKNNSTKTTSNNVIKEEVEEETNTSAMAKTHGEIKVIEDFSIPQLNTTRKVRIYLPYNYENSNENYPVIYMQDGQNLFDTSTATYRKAWEIDDTLDLLYDEGKTNGVIVVGVDANSSTRTDDYNLYMAPTVNGKELENTRRGKEYTDFIVNTLKPYIDNNYRTLKDRDNTAIVGSSYGAVISLYAGIEYSDVFSMIGAFSYCDNVNIDANREYLENNISNEKLKDTKIYFYVGSYDFAYDSTKDAYEICKEKGLKNIKYEESKGSHDENTWGPKFENCLDFFKLTK